MRSWPSKPGRLILETIAFAQHLVRLEREDSLPRIVIRTLADNAEHTIAFDEEAGLARYVCGLRVRRQHDLRFTYSSMTTPAETYVISDMGQAHAQRCAKRQEVPERER